MEMQNRPLQHCTLMSNAYQHSGTVNSASALKHWVTTGKYDSPEHELGDFLYVTAHLKTNTGNVISVSPNDWLVYDNGNFKVYTNDEFHRSFVPLESIKSRYVEFTPPTTPKTPNNGNFESVTSSDTLHVIADVRFYRFPDTTQVVCLTVLKNGFYVVGEHSSLDHVNFNLDSAKQASFAHAERKIKDLIAYTKRYGKPVA